MTKYRDKQILEELYVDKQMTMGEIAREFGCSIPTIKRWPDWHGIQTRNQAGNGKRPWHSKERLRELHVEQGLSVGNLAERFGCDDWTVEYWLRKFEIDGREPPAGLSDSPPSNHYWREDGYEVVCADQFEVRIHRLVAIAENGLNFVEDWSQYHIHHKNGVKWDNRPGNLDVVTPEEHGRIHNPKTRERATAT